MSDIRKAIHARISEGPRKEIIEGLDTPVYFRRMRMDDYIAKPVRIADLDQVIRKYFPQS